MRTSLAAKNQKLLRAYPGCDIPIFQCLFWVFFAGFLAFRRCLLCAIFACFLKKSARFCRARRQFFCWSWVPNQQQLYTVELQDLASKLRSKGWQNHCFCDNLAQKNEHFFWKNRQKMRITDIAEKPKKQAKNTQNRHWKIGMSHPGCLSNSLKDFFVGEIVNPGWRLIP